MHLDNDFDFDFKVKLSWYNNAYPGDSMKALNYHCYWVTSFAFTIVLFDY